MLALKSGHTLAEANSLAHHWGLSRSTIGPTKAWYDQSQRPFFVESFGGLSTMTRGLQWGKINLTAFVWGDFEGGLWCMLYALHIPPSLVQLDFDEKNVWMYWSLFNKQSQQNVTNKYGSKGPSGQNIAPVIHHRLLLHYIRHPTRASCSPLRPVMHSGQWSILKPHFPFWVK